MQVASHQALKVYVARSRPIGASGFGQIGRCPVDHSSNLSSPPPTSVVHEYAHAQMMLSHKLPPQVSNKEYSTEVPNRLCERHNSRITSLGPITFPELSLKLFSCLLSYTGHSQVSTSSKLQFSLQLAEEQIAVRGAREY
jgi:hypothetical protein